MENEVKEKENKYSKLQWFFFVIVIPGLFAITLFLVIMTILNVNVFEYAKNVPVVSNLVKEDKKAASESKDTKNIYTLQATIEDQKIKINEYKSKVEKKDSEIKELEKTLSTLEEELAALKEEKIKEEESIQDNIKMYENMKVKKLVPILSAMTNQEAANILKELTVSKRGEILSEMDPTRAAAITKLL